MQTQLVLARRESAEDIQDSAQGLSSRIDAVMHEVAEAKDAVSAANESSEEIQRAHAELAQQLSALLEYHSKGFMGRPFRKPRMGDSG